MIDTRDDGDRLKRIRVLPRPLLGLPLVTNTMPMRGNTVHRDRSNGN